MNEVFVDFYSRGEDTPFFRIKTIKEHAEQIIHNNTLIYKGEIEAVIENE